MHCAHSTSGPGGEHPATVERASQTRWHAFDDDRVVGTAESWHRPDGRLFVSVDSWHPAVFGRLAGAMLAELPKPVYTMVDEGDADLTSHWRRAGFTTRRREWECLLPTDPQVTGLDAVPAPPGVTIVPLGAARTDPLRRLDRVIRDEVAATVGWQEMPAEVLPLPDGDTVADPSTYAVAAESGQYVGLARVAGTTRLPRIGLLAVRADRHRRGIGRALLAQVLGSLHRSGVDTASAEVNEFNEAALALADGIGARRVRTNLELVLR